MGNGMGLNPRLHVHDELHLLGRIVRTTERQNIIALVCSIIDHFHLFRRIVPVIRPGFLQCFKNRLLDFLLATLIGKAALKE